MVKISMFFGRHIVAMFVTVFLTFVASIVETYINLVIKYGSDSGTFADMAIIGFCIMCGVYCFLLFLLSGLIGVISEVGRMVFQGRLHWLASTVLMFIVFFGTSFLTVFSLALVVFQDNAAFVTALYVSIRIGVVGIVYWLTLCVFDFISVRRETIYTGE